MNLVREPDAGNPPVRFDEREVETEHGMRLVRHRRGNPDPEYAEAYPTAPPLDSTLFVRDKWVTVPYSLYSLIPYSYSIPLFPRWAARRCTWSLSWAMRPATARWTARTWG